MENKIEWENEFIKDGKVWSKYIAVHDDSFGREKREDELVDSLDKMEVDYSFKILSKNSEGKVNMLYVEIEGSYETWEDRPFDFEIMDSVWYYNIIPCNYNPIEEEK